jgi:WD40 repeat protein
VAYSPDGRRIVTGAWGRLAKLWDADTGGELLTLDDNGLRITAVAFSRDGQRIVTGDWNRTARVWQAARPEEVAVWEAEERAAAESQDRWREELAALLRKQALE